MPFWLKLIRLLDLNFHSNRILDLNALRCAIHWGTSTVEFLDYQNNDKDRNIIGRKLSVQASWEGKFCFWVRRGDGGGNKGEEGRRGQV